jgi:hypothetical protein
MMMRQRSTLLRYLESLKSRCCDWKIDVQLRSCSWGFCSKRACTDASAVMSSERPESPKSGLTVTQRCQHEREPRGLQRPRKWVRCSPVTCKHGGLLPTPACFIGADAEGHWGGKDWTAYATMMSRDGMRFLGSGSLSTIRNSHLSEFEAWLTKMLIGNYLKGQFVRIIGAARMGTESAVQGGKYEGSRAA